MGRANFAFSAFEEVRVTLGSSARYLRERRTRLSYKRLQPPLAIPLAQPEAALSDQREDQERLHSGLQKRPMGISVSGRPTNFSRASFRLLATSAMAAFWLS